MRIPDIEAELRGKRYREEVPDTVALDVAENILLLDELRDLMVQPAIPLNREDLNYPHNSIGDSTVRTAIASLLSETWALDGERSLGAENVLCTPGATAALHLHGKVRLQRGDSIIVPAPYWQMFDRIYRDLGVSLVPLPIPVGAESAVDLGGLQTLYAQLVANGERPKMLLLTNPHNPLGIVESESTMQSFFEWVLRETEMDIVSDEIYAHSIYDASATFASAMSLELSIAYPDRVHVIWGFAKDFGLSGWMVGVLLTRSEHLHRTITKKYARFAPFDGLKNRVVKRLLCERPKEKTARVLLGLLPTRLAAAHTIVVEALENAGISYSSSSAGAPFFWLDLREYLDADFEHKAHPADCILDGPEDVGHDPREGRLQKYIACVSGMVLLRGQTMHADTPGFYRLCFSAEPAETIAAAIARMGTALRG